MAAHSSILECVGVFGPWPRRHDPRCALYDERTNQDLILRRDGRARPGGFKRRQPGQDTGRTRRSNILESLKEIQAQTSETRDQVCTQR